jgi:hypothetical protein
MEAPSTPSQPRRGSTARAILVGGLAAGLCDFIFAVVYFQNATWNRIARLIAGGLLGRDIAFNSGAWVVPLGIVLHFVVALGAATVFGLASRKLTWLRRFPGPAGLAYGIVVYFVMSWVVVPLSALHPPQYPPPIDWGSLAGHMAVVGLPIALAVHWFGPRPSA